MSDIAALVSDHLDIWTAATERKNGAGRGGGKRMAFYGIDSLRALVLDLAVRGKLVPQDTSEEPASISLNRIPDEWTNAKRRHRSKLPLEQDDASQGDVPPGWARVSGNVVFRTRSGNSKLIKGQLYSENQDGLFPGFSASGQDVWLDQWEHEGTAVILSAVGARCGKAFLATGKWSAVANTHIIWLLEDVTIPAFAMLVLNNENFWLRAGGAQPFVKVGATLDRDLFLPPLAEQRRIVAKVDELMALCDALEGESAAALEAHQTLVETLLGTLVNSADPADLAANWSRLEAHFDTLVTTEASIDALKQKILDLAVGGKLVKQDTGDEPATVLLERIQAERVKILGERQASKAIATTTAPNDLPLGWVYSRLAHLGLAMTGGTPKSSQPENFDGSIPFIGPGQISPTGEILPAEKFISEIGLDQSTEAISGDVLMVCIGGSIGKSAIARARMAYNQQINAIRPMIVESRYVDLYLRCSRFQQAVLDRATGSATPIINRGKWETIPVAIPPLAEQHRIISKVDALMTLCDGLKASIADAGQIQMRLADAIVERAAA